MRNSHTRHVYSRPVLLSISLNASQYETIFPGFLTLRLYAACGDYRVCIAAAIAGTIVPAAKIVRLPTISVCTRSYFPKVLFYYLEQHGSPTSLYRLWYNYILNVRNVSIFFKSCLFGSMFTLLFAFSIVVSTHLLYT